MAALSFPSEGEPPLITKITRILNKPENKKQHSTEQKNGRHQRSV
jgi:hypothetical protein